MPQFLAVPQPVFPPRRCITCLAQEGEMVDLIVQWPWFEGRPGRVYLCRTCVHAAGYELEMVDRKHADALLDELALAKQEIGRLKAQLNKADDIQPVSMQRLRKLVRDEISPRRRGRPAKEVQNASQGH